MQAVLSMKQAVNIAIQHGDISQYSVCLGLGMTTSELSAWLISRSQSCWDTKVAEWLKRTQGRDIEKGLRSTGSGPGRTEKPPPRVEAIASSKRSKDRSVLGDEMLASPRVPRASTLLEETALKKLRDELLELEDYIPWNAVVSSWTSKRTSWARRTRECLDARAVSRQLVVLESALTSNALEPEWRGSIRDEWAAELAKETDAHEVLEYLTEMEGQIKWSVFRVLPALQEAFKRLVATAGGVLLREVVVVIGNGSSLTIKQLKTRMDTFHYESLSAMARDIRHLAAASSDPSLAHAAMSEAFKPFGIVADQENGNVSGEENDGTGMGGGLDAPSPPLNRAGSADNVQLQEDIRNTGVKRSRMVDKKAKYEQFKRQQRLYPECSTALSSRLHTCTRAKRPRPFR